jgi:UDP-N-acetylmuramoyl-tripeptide--D-alanyl-D-alanine ligase
MTVLWTSDAAASATQGRVLGGAWQASGLSIDTRSLTKGDLFIALSDQRDGHDFVASAFEKGATAALVSYIPAGLGADTPLLLVKNVQTALEDLGRAGRARTRARVIGVTGSAGKTSTKEMLRKTLSGQGRTHAAEASFNNHWGVPLTLARLPQDVDFAIIEIGMNHPGEIAPLAQMANLDVALITTVAAAHLEAFASVTEIAYEKAAIFQGLRPNGAAIVPCDLAQSPLFLDAARASSAQIFTFETGAGVQGADLSDAHSLWRAQDVVMTQDQSTLKVICAPQSAYKDSAAGLLMLRIAAPGQHYVANALAVLATAQALGLDLTVSALDLGQWKPVQGRGQAQKIWIDATENLSFALIDDAFNANPASLAASLAVLALYQPMDGVGRLRKGRRIAILGDMLELGPEELTLHCAIATLPAMAAVHVVHCVGPRMRALYEALPPTKRGLWVETPEELMPRAHHLIDAGDVVLVKGSKGSKVALMVEALRNLGQEAPDSGVEDL